MHTKATIGLQKRGQALGYILPGVVGCVRPLHKALIKKIN